MTCGNRVIISQVLEFKIIFYFHFSSPFFFLVIFGAHFSLQKCLNQLVYQLNYVYTYESDIKGRLQERKEEKKKNNNCGIYFDRYIFQQTI